MSIQLTITTPERVTLDQTVEQVSIPTKLGYITVLPHHIPLVAQVVPGELIVKSAGKEETFAVAGGFVEVLPDKVTILADIAERPEEIDVRLAEEARARAEKLRAEKQVDSEEYAGLTAVIERELTRIKIAHKKKH